MSELGTYVYDRTIDYMQNRVKDNPVRDEYDRYMSQGQYNNNDMASLVDVIMAFVENELPNTRSDSEAEAVIRDIIIAAVDANVGAFAMSDRRIADAVPDDMYSALGRAAAKWEEMLNRVRGGARRPAGLSGGRVGFGGGAGGGRNVFGSRDTGVFGGRRNVFDREEPQQTRATNSPFGGRPGAPAAAASSSFFDRPTAAAPRSSGFGQTARGSYAAPMQESPLSRPAPEAPVEEALPPQDGPDMSKERPYDDFWVEGEHWQLAHKSNWKWKWSPKQQTRRAYDIDQEVCFLVEGKDGTIREEFIAMTDDLVETAHEIRKQVRPNRPRTALERQDNDPIFEGDDIDAVDLDALNNTIVSARKELLSELDLSNPTIHQSALAISGLEEAALRVAGAATKTESDVTSINAIDSVQLAADPETIKGLESIKSLGAGDADLQMLQKRLQSLRGTMAENVLTFLDKHYTKEVNSVLRDQFGQTGLSIDSFIEDFADLLNCKSFKTFGQAYVTQFLSRTKVLLLGLHYITDSEERAEFLECSDILPIAEEDPEAYKQFRENVVVLFRPMATLHVKIDSDKFGLVTSDVRTPQRQGEGADPEMADVLTGLYAIGRKTAGAGHVYMVTADNVCFELVPISGARNIVGIRMA
jgi:hypothetical protein